LRYITAHPSNSREIARGFYTFSNSKTAEAMSELHRHPAECRVSRVYAAAGHKASIELQLGKGKFLEPRQRRISAAEIVERQRYMVDAELRAPARPKRGLLIPVGDGFTARRSCRTASRGAAARLTKLMVR
jgi:hypothetical protein